MIKSKERSNNINRLKKEIYLEFGNPKYLQITGKRSFDDVIGTKLWQLWYGAEVDDFSVRRLEFYERQCEQGFMDMEVFENQLIDLRNNLKSEFDKLKKEKEKK